MPEPKDGPMACTDAQMPTYANELKNLRAHCIRLLEEHEESTPDQLWSEADGTGPTPQDDRDLARLKLVTTVSFENGKPVFPPTKTRLSDELVYLATKFLTGQGRGEHYPYDFSPRGDIRPERVPSGPGPIVWAHGLPFFPIFKGYYILCGRNNVTWIGWLLHKKEFKVVKDYPLWTIGPVVAPRSAVELDRTIERQLRVHKPASMKDVEKGSEKAPAARDVVSMLHNHGSVVPKTSSGGFVISELYRVPGYTVRCGPAFDNGRKAQQLKRAWFTEHRVSNFDWEKSSKSRYSNERNPRVLFSDDEDEENDAGGAMESDADSSADASEEGMDAGMNDEEETSPEAGDDLRKNGQGNMAIKSNDPVIDPMLYTMAVIDNGTTDKEMLDVVDTAVAEVNKTTDD